LTLDIAAPSITALQRVFASTSRRGNASADPGQRLDAQLLRLLLNAGPGQRRIDGDLESINPRASGQRFTARCRARPR
jgi:hypothetical protein